MADIRKFKSYIEELSGNNFLKKQMAALEKANTKLERELKAIKDEIKLLNKQKAAPVSAKSGKRRGRKPRTMLQIIEAEMAKTKDKQMKVTDIVKTLKTKFNSKAKNMYASVSASMNNSDKFEKADRGVYKLVDEGDAKQAEKKAAAPQKKANAMKPVAKKPLAKKAPAKKKPAAKKAVAPVAESEAKKPVAKKKATAKKKAPAKKKAVAKKAVAKASVNKDVAPVAETEANKPVVKKKAPGKKSPAKKKTAAKKKQATTE